MLIFFLSFLFFKDGVCICVCVNRRKEGGIPFNHFFMANLSIEIKSTISRDVNLRYRKELALVMYSIDIIDLQWSPKQGGKKKKKKTKKSYKIIIHASQKDNATKYFIVYSTGQRGYTIKVNRHYCMCTTQSLSLSLSLTQTRERVKHKLTITQTK